MLCSVDEQFNLPRPGVGSSFVPSHHAFLAGMFGGKKANAAFRMTYKVKDSKVFQAVPLRWCRQVVCSISEIFVVVVVRIEVRSLFVPANHGGTFSGKIAHATLRITDNCKNCKS